jgi:hypothetical protein
MVMHVWSKHSLGGMGDEWKCVELASAFLDRIRRDEVISKQTGTVLHFDNDARIRSFTLAAMMEELMESLSFSKPDVRNDESM